MIKINIKTLISVIFLLTLLFNTLSLTPVNADSLWDNQVGVGTNPGEVGEAFGYVDEPDSIQLVISRIIKIFLGLLGIIFLVLIILAGYKWMTAQGAEEQITKAKSQLKSSVIGLSIVLMAYAITLFITEYLFEASINN